MKEKLKRNEQEFRSEHSLDQITIRHQDYHKKQKSNEREFGRRWIKSSFYMFQNRRLIQSQTTISHINRRPINSQDYQKRRGKRNVVLAHMFILDLQEHIVVSILNLQEHIIVSFAYCVELCISQITLSSIYFIIYSFIFVKGSREQTLLTLCIEVVVCMVSVCVCVKQPITSSPHYFSSIDVTAYTNLCYKYPTFLTEVHEKVPWSPLIIMNFS